MGQPEQRTEKHSRGEAVSDIVDRLQSWVHAVDAAPASDLMDEAAVEIKRLRSAICGIVEQDCTLSVVNGIVYVDDSPVCSFTDNDTFTTQ